MENSTIEQAKELLQPITFKPHYVGYFVTQNDDDMGGEDYCENCIKGAVKETRKYYKEQRQAILNKFKILEETGYWNGKDIKGKYSDLKIKQEKRRRLAEYPAKVKFDYEGHDPDFSGGQHEPRCCEGCGEYFDTDFEPDIEEAESMLSAFGDGTEISESLKWKLDIAFYNFGYLDDDVKDILLSIAMKIIGKVEDCLKRDDAPG